MAVEAVKGVNKMPKKISKGKVIGSILVSAVLEVGVICLSDIAVLAQRYKIPNLKKEMIVSSLKELGHHPIGVTAGIAKGKNPIFILGSLVVLIIFLKLIFNSSKKSKYEIEPEYAVHGSSRYSEDDEIFIEKQTAAVPVRQFLNDLEEKIKGGSEDNG